MKQKALFLLIFLGLNMVLNAQITKSESKKVGLVLSGGGAKGFAHIGVLKVIDSLGIKIDYIAGTSMGAVLGSLYASGYSGKQLDSIFKRVDINDLINDKLPRESKTAYERENSEKYAITLPLENFKIKLPSALSRGQNSFDLLTKLMVINKNERDFSKLPIPFLCIATNVENGSQVLLESGNLPLAVKASSALPSLFQPVMIDNQLLIDGGVVNNYPIDELRAKGMDIIIGVDVQDGLANRTDLSSAPKILFQINNFRTINDMKEKRPKTDIYIKPDITAFNLVSFSDGDLIIKEGVKAANRKLSELSKYKRKGYKKPSIKVATDSLYIKEINTSGNEQYTASYIKSKLKIDQNTTVSFKDFNKGTNNLLATNNFDSFFYEFKPNDDGYDLYTKTIESKNDFSLRLAVHYDNLYDAGLLVNFTKKRLLFKNDVIALDLILGSSLRYKFNYFIDKGEYWSVGLNSRYNEFTESIKAVSFLDVNSTQNLNRLSVKYSDLTNQFFLQTQFRKDFPLRLGVEHKKLKFNTTTISSNINPEGTTFEDSHIYSVFGEISFDTFDNLYFPTKGVLFKAKANYYAFSSNYNNNFTPYSIYDADFSYAVNPIKKLSFLFNASAGLTLKARNNSALNFTFGGFGHNFINNIKSFYGYDYSGISANSYVKFLTHLDYQFLKKHHLLASVNYANIEDELFKSSNWLSVPDYTGYALGYSYESIIGPLELKYTYSPDQKTQYWFFNIGFWF